MLTESGYLGGLLVYVLAALLALFLFQFWLLRSWRMRFRLLLLLPLAGLLLTPAYIEPEAQSMAPALVIAAFQSLTLDVESAMHAIRPLVLFTGVGFLLSLLILGVLTLRGR